MRLSLQTDYSLRTLMFLAVHRRRSTVSEVARFYSISTPHVAKVVHVLARAGLLRSLRGAGGGIELSRPAEKVSVGEVIRCVEGNMHLLDCVAADGVCEIQDFCPLIGVLAEAERRQMDYLDSIPISEILPGQKQVEGRLIELETASHA